MIYCSFCCIYVWLDPGTYMIARFMTFYKPGVTLASKCLVRQSPTPGIVIHFHPDSSTTTPAQNLHCVPIHSKRFKILQKFPLKVFNSRRTWSYLLLQKKGEKELPMISKSSSKEEFNKMTQKCFQKCEFISPSPLDNCDSIRSEFDQVPTSCEPLFGSATQVIKVCHTLPTHNSRNLRKKLVKFWPW